MFLEMLYLCIFPCCFFSPCLFSMLFLVFYSVLCFLFQCLRVFLWLSWNFLVKFRPVIGDAGIFVNIFYGELYYLVLRISDDFWVILGFTNLGLLGISFFSRLLKQILD